METSYAPAAAAALPEPLAICDDLPPWIVEKAEPPARCAPPRRSPVLRSVANRPRRPAFEAVPGDILALTLVTALSVILGSYFGAPSQPRELLPIMISVAP